MTFEEWVNGKKYVTDVREVLGLENEDYPTAVGGFEYPNGWVIMRDQDYQTWSTMAYNEDTANPSLSAVEAWLWERVDDCDKG